MKFYLGVPEPVWLTRSDVPMFVSRRRLARYKKMPRALGEWSLDSSAFTEISLNGRWTIPASTYAAEARRYMWEVGNMNFAAVQDWMCEPFIIAKTGLSVEEHQRRTINSTLELRSLAPEVPWAPVLQGWSLGDYTRHREMYLAAGIDLAKEPVVGIGSVCRRNASEEIGELAESLSDLKLHGFGVKTRGVEIAARFFASTDSMAWSFRARHCPPLPGCRHRTCSNCLRFALHWRDGFLAKLAAVSTQPRQLGLALEAA